MGMLRFERRSAGIAYGCHRQCRCAPAAGAGSTSQVVLHPLRRTKGKRAYINVYAALRRPVRRLSLCCFSGSHPPEARRHTWISFAARKTRTAGSFLSSRSLSYLYRQRGHRWERTRKTCARRPFFLFCRGKGALRPLSSLRTSALLLSGKESCIFLFSRRQSGPLFCPSASSFGGIGLFI